MFGSRAREVMYAGCKGPAWGPQPAGTVPGLHRGRANFYPRTPQNCQAQWRPAQGRHVMDVCCAEQESLLRGGEHCGFHFATNNTEH